MSISMITADGRIAHADTAGTGKRKVFVHIMFTQVFQERNGFKYGTRRIKPLHGPVQKDTVLRGTQFLPILRHRARIIIRFGHQRPHIPGGRFDHDHSAFSGTERVVGRGLQVHIQRRHQTVPDVFFALQLIDEPFNEISIGCEQLEISEAFDPGFPIVSVSQNMRKCAVERIDPVFRSIRFHPGIRQDLTV